MTTVWQDVFVRDTLTPISLARGGTQTLALDDDEDPLLAGFVLHHAAILLDPMTFFATDVSEPWPLTLA